MLVGFLKTYALATTVPFLNSNSLQEKLCGARNLESQWRWRRALAHSFMARRREAISDLISDEASNN
jgi:hypothetical protein